MEDLENLPKNRIPVIDPYGTFGTIDASQVNYATSRLGYRIPSPEEIRAQVVKEKHGTDSYTNSGKAFLAGMAEGPTLGLSNQALVKSGKVGADTLNTLYEGHPYSRLAGNVVGGVAGVAAGPAIATGLSGLAGPFAGGAMSTLLNPVYRLSQVANLATRGVGKVAAPVIGSAANMLVNPATRPIANKVLSDTGGAALGSTIDAAIFGGVQNTITENALGDKEINAENILANAFHAAPYGTLLGGGFGLAGSAIKRLGSAKGISKEMRALEKRGATPKTGEPSPSGSTPPFVDDIKVAHEPAQPAPMSGEDLAERVKSLNLGEIDITLPGYDRLVEANQNMGHKLGAFPVLPPQLESKKNPVFERRYKSYKLYGTQDSNNLVLYEAAQKDQGMKILDHEINSISPKVIHEIHSKEAGSSVLKEIVSTIKKKESEIAPKFKKIEEISIKPISNPQDLWDELLAVEPGLSKYIQMTEEGLQLAPFTEKMPLPKAAYKAAQKILQISKDEEVTIKELLSLRDNLRENVDWLNKPKEASKVAKVTDVLLNYAQKEIDKLPVELNLKTTLKDYAVLQTQKTDLEKALNGSLSDYASARNTVVPEDVLGNLFATSVDVNLLRETLGQEKFKEVLEQYLYLARRKTMTEGKSGFSSNRFATFLKNKIDVLNDAFSDQPQTLRNIRDITDIMTLLPDSQSGNPSGTASTAIDFARRAGLTGKAKELIDIIKHPIATIANKTLGAFDKHMIEQGEKEAFEALLRGDTSAIDANPSVANELKMATFKSIEEGKNSFTKSVLKGAKEIFLFGDKHKEPWAGYVGSTFSREDVKKEYEEMSKRVSTLNYNPDALYELVDQSTQALYYSAPETAMAAQSSLMKLVQYMGSKFPSMDQKTPLSRPKIPSNSDLFQFSKMMSVFKDPTQVLSDIKSKTLTPDVIEMLSNVYPSILSNMRTEVMDQLTDYVSKPDREELPLGLKISLSLFLGMDLDESLQGNHLASTQLSLANQGDAQEQANQRSMKSMNRSTEKFKASNRMKTPMQESADRE